METKKMKPSILLKSLFLSSGLDTKKVGEKTNRTQSSVNGILRNETMNIKTLSELMGACDQPLVLLLKTGETVELDLAKE